ncbi:MAG: ABC transporter permease [Deltaproteobacteria bacterium]|nr:ABC transporter permease [Deltaproteobacteria bacterium]
MLRLLLQRVRQDKLTVSCLLIIVLVVTGALFAPRLVSQDPLAQSLSERRQPPSSSHLLGVDEMGRDILSRLAYGSRNTLGIALLSTAIALLSGTALGLVAGYYGGAVDASIMWLMDLMLAFPYLLLAILIVATLGSGMLNTAIAIGIAAVPAYCRVVRSSVLAVREELFITAEISLGAGDGRVLLGHVLPNVLAPVVVMGTLGIANAILGGAALGFLGLGTQPPAPEWGVMLSGGRSFLLDAPHISFFPGLALALLVFSCNILGDTLRDVLDPKLKT